MFFLSSISAFCLFNSREGNSTLLKKRPLPFYGTLVDMWRCISDTRWCCDPISASGNGHFSHFRRLVQSFDGSVVLRPHQAEPCPHLVLHVLLGDNDEGCREYTNTHTGTYWFTNTNEYTCLQLQIHILVKIWTLHTKMRNMKKPRRRLRLSITLKNTSRLGE